MLTVIRDGVEALVIPDCARCKVDDEKINDMEKCPLGRCVSDYECDPDCEYYAEKWD